MYTVSFDAAALLQGMNLQLESLIAQAVQSTAQTAQIAWQQTVLQTPGLWQPIRDRYAASIKVEYDANGMGARIFSDDPMATPIETGIPERDLKVMLDTSVKVRKTKSGARYLVIPFRHNSGGGGALGRVMPAGIYQAAQALTKSRVTGKINVRSGLNASDPKTKGPLMTMRSTYAWGSRLPAGMAPKMRAHHATDIYASMVRFDTSSGKQNSSSYVTFRIMREGSSGWIVPAKPGNYIVKSVSEQAQKMLASEVKEAIASVLAS
jgi:hypothetical protein